MPSMYNIFTVAKFESKTLFRSWFFRIFSILIFLFIGMFNLFGIIGVGDGGWAGRVLPSAVPYYNFFVLNVVQAVIAVFLSADFLGRDKKLDTTEAFYVRSMSNTEYVLGKTLGILKVFMYLNLIVIGVSFLSSIISSDVSINVLSVFLYPMLLSLPTLVFILGLSFFTMTLVRNQAVTFVLLLGLIALQLFYGQTKLFGLTDFLGFYTPMLKSDFSSFGNELDLFRVRFGFFAAGIVLIFATIWRLPRLDQQKRGSLAAVGVIVVFSALVGWLFYGKVSADLSNQQLRERIQLANQALPHPGYHIHNYAVELEHNGDEIDVKTSCYLTRSTLNDTLVLALNPGLKVTEVQGNGAQLAFDQKDHLVIVTGLLAMPDSAMIELSYGGKILDFAMFPDINENAWKEGQRFEVLVGNKQYSFVTDDYLLLTREAHWYPVVAAPRYWASYPLVSMQLRVKDKPGKEVISQGRKEAKDGWQYFTQETPVNAYGLIIGNYERLSTMVDSVELVLYHHPKHDYFKRYFNALEDTVAPTLKVIKEDFERKLGLSYPFKSLEVVEVPINFYSYLRNWSLATEHQLPGQIFLAESGGGEWSQDIKRQYNRNKERSEENGEEKSEKELQTEVLKNYVGGLFIEPERWWWGRRQQGERSVDNWSRQQLFPQYYSFTNRLVEPGYPLLNIALETYLHKRLKDERNSFIGGLSTNDEVILMLREKSLNALIESEDANTLGNVFASKGNQLLAGMRVNGPSSFDKDLSVVVMSNRSVNLEINDLSERMSTLIGQDFTSMYSTWLNDNQLPSFRFSTAEAVEVKQDNRIQYFMTVTVANTGSVTGIVTFTIREGQQSGGRGGRFRQRFGQGGDDAGQKHNFSVAANETVDLGFLLDDAPREVKVETYLAANIPSINNLEINTVDNPVRQPQVFEGRRTSVRNLRYKADNEVIVDNEDEGFSFVNTSESRTVKDWWTNRQNSDSDEDGYGSLRFWSPPVKWRPIAGENYFGDYLHSAAYKRRGSGEGTAVWTTNMEHPGYYEVYAFVPRVDVGRRRRRSRNESHKYHYEVRHQGGAENVEITVDRDNNGWMYLGYFYFDKGEAQVQLSDASDAPYVIADAVKWIKK